MKVKSLIFLYFLIFFFSLSFYIAQASSRDTSVGLQVTCPNDVCSNVVKGCTDPKATNYNASANSNDGSCSYSPTVITDVSGCLDPEATNYNSKATVSSGDCIYAPVPNVTDFVARYIESRDAVRLTWVNPNIDFEYVRIVRLTNKIPTGPNDGILVYEGKGTLAWDYNVKAGDKYFYGAYVLDKRGRFSSGAIASAEIPTKFEPPIIPPGIINPPITGPTSSPFSNLPVYQGNKSKLSQSIWNLRFIQPKEAVRSFDPQMKVTIKGEKYLTIEMNSSQLPTVLKTIGVTIVDPEDQNRTMSFVLHANADRTLYTATLPPFVKNGVYSIFIYLINYENQTILPIRGKLIVSGVNIVQPSLLALAKNTAGPVATAGLVVSFLPSLTDILTMLARFLSYLFRRKRKEKPWGTVYDSVTKRPLDPAYVSVEKDGKEITSAITDIDGRFGFLLPSGVYTVKASKTHYSFPSAKLVGRTEDELYTNLYFGSTITTQGEEILNLNIPMDPTDFDWNEFAKTKTNFFKFYSRRELLTNRLFDFVYTFGLTVAILALIFTPSIFNIIMVLLYGVIYLIDKIIKTRNKARKIYRQSTGEPLSFALLKIYLPEVNQLIKSVAADKLGQFYVLIRPGKYYYTIEEKMLDGSYQKIYQSSPIDMPKGIFTDDLIV